MRIVFISFFLLLTSTVFSQVQKKLEGTWKLAIIQDDELYYNIKKDSISMPGMEQMDSAMIKSMAEIFTLMRDASFVFEKDGSYSTTFIKKTINGTYTVDEENSTITTSFKKPDGATTTERIKYSFKDAFLVLSFIESSSALHMTLEKQ